MTLLFIYLFNETFFEEEMIKIREDKIRECQTWNIFFQHLGISLKILLVNGHFSWSTFGLHLVRGPKAL
jgi:hypothetical protein